jgi:molybdopterin-guanine dinucleotide biosynthesis protein A
MQISHNTTLANDVTGVILAGGKSRRMGRDKATLVVAGERLVTRTEAMLRGLFAEVIIAGDRPDLAREDLPCVPDRHPGSALGGVHGALAAAGTPWIFVVPCDLAYPDAALVRFILARRDDRWDAVVPCTPGGFEPVFALYHRRCLEPVAAMLARGELRIYDLYRQIRVCLLDAAILPAGWERALLNLNTPDEFRRLTKEAP